MIYGPYCEYIRTIQRYDAQSGPPQLCVVLVYLSFICAGENAQMRKRVFRHLCLYFSTDSRVIQNIDAQWKPKKRSRDKNFTFSFAHAELRKRVFLNFLRYLPTDFEAVTEYAFGMIARMIYSVNLTNKKI